MDGTRASSQQLSSLRVFKGLPIQRKLYSLINIPLMHYLPKEKTPPSEARPSYAEMRTIVEERNGVIFPEPAMQLVLMHERGSWQSARAPDAEAGAKQGRLTASLSRTCERGIRRPARRQTSTLYSNCKPCAPTRLWACLAWRTSRAC